MKKLIASILASSMILGIFAGVAGAESRTSLINKELEKKDEIHILYNDKMVQYEDVKPINNEDRVMIPFRAALENMGASVEYDDSERLVTATKGDITIHFTLLDDIIYINNNGEESTITMDVPMIIVQDRTLVPIRFMSNALGMQVGWDGDTQTVVIMDYTTYFNEFEQNIPNLNNLSALTRKSFNKREFELGFTLDKAIKGENSYFLADVSGTASAGDTTLSTEGTLFIDSDKLKADQTDMTIIATDKSKLYLQSNLINSMAENTDDKDVLKAAASDSVWYSIDLKKLFSSIGLNNNFLGLLNTIFLPGENKSLTTLLSEGANKEGEADYSEAINLAMALDLYERLDKYIDVEETKEGYNIKVEATTEVFADIISDILGWSLSESDKEIVLKTIGYSLIANIESKVNVQRSDINLEIAIPGEDSLQVTFTLNETATNDRSAKVMTEPTNSYDITDIIAKIVPHSTSK